MARTKTKGAGKMPATAAEAEIKSVRLELDGVTHREFRIEAAREGQSMAALAKRLVEEWVAKRKAAGR
jgi:hypothetical protein